jgi:hypothetical protein
MVCYRSRAVRIPAGMLALRGPRGPTHGRACEHFVFDMSSRMSAACAAILRPLDGLGRARHEARRPVGLAGFARRLMVDDGADVLMKVNDR